MKVIKRTLYLGYYLKQMNWKLLKRFLNYTQQKTRRSKLSLWLDIVYSCYVYNISILEYFQFRFFDKEREERKKWAGTGTMYEFQLKANPPNKRAILDDKRLFYKNYREFFVHQVFTLDEIDASKILLEQIIKNNEKLVLKDSIGKCGAGVQIILTEDFTKESLLELMKKKRFDMIETFIEQHSEINRVSPSAVNTIRIFTNIDSKGKYEILGCRFRISVNSPVDNLAAGNLAAPIEVCSGKIIGPGVYSDITKAPELVHPITQVGIEGFQIPYWDEILEMVKKASLKHPQNKSIGWDVVLTQDGPGLIEGNHDWCKLLWQLPVNMGLKEKLNV